MAKLLGADAARVLLAEQAACGTGHRVLEIGCGTGSLLLLLKKTQPGAEVVGLDPDPNALAIARRKGERQASPFSWTRDSRTRFPTPTPRSTAFSPPSCTTTCRAR
jgi:ubiquinone/menaquinone biosynthesis C-methylase UbiE